MKERTDMTKSDTAPRQAAAKLAVYTPAVDIYENDDEFLIYADMPGVAQENITVNVDNGTMIVSGKRKLNSKGAASWQEFGDVEFRRSFSVPRTINVDTANARLNNGTLCLHLPKTEAAKPRQIEIKAS